MEDESKQNEYCVIVHLNIPTEEDFVFLITALHHFEKKHPIYSSKLHKSLDEIVKTVKKIVAAPVLKNDTLPPIVQIKPLSDIKIEEIIDVVQLPPTEPS